jgi:hypothetical protein
MKELFADQAGKMIESDEAAQAEMNLELFHTAALDRAINLYC